MGSAPSRRRQGETQVSDYLKSGGSRTEELVFNPETGKLEIMNMVEARVRPGREVVTAMSKRDGGGFFGQLQESVNSKENVKN